MLSARGLDTLLAEMQKLEVQLEESADEKLVRRYGALEDQFAGLGGYAAEAEAARICANLGLPDRALAQTIGTLSGGQRRRIELARILFRELRPERPAASCCSTSPPTTSTPTRSPGCAATWPSTRAASS